MTETPKPTPAPPLPPEIEGGFVEYGRETLKAGMTLAEWEERMVEHLGAGVRPHLRRAWDTIHRTDATTPKEEPKTMGENKMWFLKRAALGAIVVVVLFALGIAWTGGLYTVTIVPFDDRPSQMLYRTNRITGTVDIARCYYYRPAAGLRCETLPARPAWGGLE